MQVRRGLDVLTSPATLDMRYALWRAPQQPRARETCSHSILERSRRGRALATVDDRNERLRNLLAMELFNSLFDDESLVRQAQSPVAAVVAEHRDVRAAYQTLIATLAVPDTQLAELSRQLPTGVIIPVSVIITGGAGGLLALTRRELPGVAVVSAEPALRDLDDLAGNAARVVSAAAELGPDVAVFVGLPYAPGWEAAVEHIEAAGLYAKIEARETQPRQTVEQLSILIEADLPFKISNRRDTGWLTMLMAIDALVGGASIDDAAQLIQVEDHDQIGAVVSTWNQAAQARIRRRLRRMGADPVQKAINDLKVHKLLEPP
jgi:hypothetical protein